MPYFIGIGAFLFAFTLALSVFHLILGKKLAEKKRIVGLIAGTQPSSEKAYKARRKAEKSKRPFRGMVVGNLATQLSSAGIRLRVEEFLLIWVGFALGPALAAYLMQADWIVSLALAIIGFASPFFYLKWKRSKRIALLEDQLSSALVIIGNCLKTGLSFHHALESIVREMPDPISKEFARVLKEVQLGLTMETALNNMAERLKSKDFTLIVSAVLIQRQVGGNLSEIMQNISDTIRERLQIKANLRVLTSTGRISGRVVGLMPVFLLLVLMVLNPSYIRAFFETEAGTMMLFIAGVLEAMGFMIAKRMVRVKY